jgi:hypothetical protein
VSGRGIDDRVGTTQSERGAGDGPIQTDPPSLTVPRADD